MLTPAIASITTGALTLGGQSVSVKSLAVASKDQLKLHLSADPAVRRRVEKAVAMVDQAIADNRQIYGVTTGFGGMADKSIPCELAASSQENLLSFLAAGAGDPLEARHTRAAMILRANVLLQGCSGARYELIERLITLVNADAIPVVRELGSIGASGDLVPLSVIARTIIGSNAMVELGGQSLMAREALLRLNLEPLSLRPKEGLALVNGTSFSSAIAAGAVYESQKLMSVAIGAHALMLRSLLALQAPFADFVHQKKPHPGQIWIAAAMKDLLSEGQAVTTDQAASVQDRYSLRCLPQYFGPIVEGIARVRSIVETEMNSVSDNPLVDTDAGDFHQSGNFLGQYIAVSMDELRRHIGLMAKHLDVQLATLVTPEFSRGLPPSLRGNDAKPYNMGLKGLQITANSIMPMLTWQANPITEHFPTHAEQYNQNINGLSWGSANLAWQSVKLFRQYLGTSLISAVQACDLRARGVAGHFDGRVMLGELGGDLYESVYRVLGVPLGKDKPLVFDDTDRWLEQDIESLKMDLENGDEIHAAVAVIDDSFEAEFCETS